MRDKAVENKLKGIKNQVKKEEFITMWNAIKAMGRKGYILSELKRDAFIGFFLGLIMHYRVGLSVKEYFSIELLIRLIIYTSIYSAGGMIFSSYRWKSLKKKYKYYRRENLI